MYKKLAFLISIIFLTGCHPRLPIQKQFPPEIANAYNFYPLPRTGKGIGYIYEFDENARIKKKPICRSLFTSDYQPSPEFMNIATVHSSSEYDSTFNLALLSSLLKDPLSADMKVNYKKNIDLTLGKIHEYTTYENELVNLKTSDYSCIQVLKKKKRQGKLDSLMLVTSVLEVQSINYNFSKLITSDSSLTLPKIKNILDINSSLVTEHNKTKTLIVNEPRLIAFQAQKVVDILPDGLVGLPSATIKTDVLNFTELRNKLQNKD